MAKKNQIADSQVIYYMTEGVELGMAFEEHAPLFDAREDMERQAPFYMGGCLTEDGEVFEYISLAPLPQRVFNIAKCGQVFENLMDGINFVQVVG